MFDWIDQLLLAALALAAAAVCVWLASRHAIRPAAPAPPEHRPTNLGILFDTRELGDSEYGLGAYRLFFNLLDPERLTNCTLYDGDTTATLVGRAEQYCIRVEAQQPEQIEYLHEIFAACDSRALPPGESRFLPEAALVEEPLLRWAWTDAHGALHTLSMARAAYIHGTAWWLSNEPRPTLHAHPHPTPPEKLHLQPVIAPSHWKDAVWRAQHAAEDAGEPAPAAEEPPEHETERVETS
jgi:hypothetical protein